jgi:hypothetical protein
LASQRYTLPDSEIADKDRALREAVMATVAAWKALYGKVPPLEARPASRPRNHGTQAWELADLRCQALTKLYAADARKDEKLIEFRRAVLGDQLLPGGEEIDRACRAWIEGFNRGWMYFGTLMEARFVASEPDEDKHYDMLEQLRQLHELTEELGHRYDWIKGAATQFVLADQDPEASTLRAGGRIPYSWISASRITMVIDPMVSPEDVADFYQRVRKSNSYFAGAQVRPLKAKALHLAAFSADIRPGERSVDQVKRWNELHPDHTYDHTSPTAISNFVRDMKLARDRLLNPKLGAEANRNAQKALNQSRASRPA